MLLNDGPGALDMRLKAIDSATQAIELQTFLWIFDTTGALVLDHLLNAADRGVQIRMLIDDSFLLHEEALLMALAEHANIEYRVYNPFKRRSGGMLARQVFNLNEFGRLDHRMHNKSMVVDGRIAIVGGRNLADEYFGLHETANFRDLELLIGGPLVTDIGAAFDQYWNDPWAIPIEMVDHARASEEQLATARSLADNHGDLHATPTASELAAFWPAIASTADTGHTRLLVDRPPEKNPDKASEAPVQVANELLQLLEQAEQDITIVSAYLIPTETLETTLADAVARGVRVRLLTNSISSNNHLSAHSAYRNHIHTLLSNGAELHEVRTDARERGEYMLDPVEQKALALHAKGLIIDDDTVFIGSANLDPRSMRLNTEMGVVVRSEAFNTRVREAVEPDFSGANAWQLELTADQKVQWVGDDMVLTVAPANSFMQRLEDWFLALLPLEDEM